MRLYNHHHHHHHRPAFILYSVKTSPRCCMKSSSIHRSRTVLSTMVLMTMMILSQRLLQQKPPFRCWTVPSVVVMVNAFTTSFQPQQHPQSLRHYGTLSFKLNELCQYRTEFTPHSVFARASTRCYQSTSSSSSSSSSDSSNIPTAASTTTTTTTMDDDDDTTTTIPNASTATGSKVEVTTAPKGPKLRRILSGVQPTGSLHLGNYFGAIQQWVQFQNKYCPIIDEDENDDPNDTSPATDVVVENYFCVVDLHAITSTQQQTPEELYRSSLMSVALYIAAGIDPKRSKIFIQSHVKAHTELTWLLQCMTPINWVERMIQYKEKAKKMQDNSVSTGLMTYPILMAADILLYQATEVPVGEDQRQHLELTRDIARRFHDMYCTGNAYKKRMKAYQLSTYPVFTEPTAMIASTTSGTSRIMSLTDGTNKMSKSDPNDYSRINLLDPPELIRDKIKRCKTDAEIGIEWDNPTRPEATNLLNIYAAVQPHRSREEIQEEVQSMTWGTFKPLLADAIIDHVLPIQTKYYEIMPSDDTSSSSKNTMMMMMVEDNVYLNQVLQEGATAANRVASQTLQKVKVAMGFVIPTESSLK